MVSKSAWFGRAFFLFLGLANLGLLASVACSATNDGSWQIEWEKTLQAAELYHLKARKELLSEIGKQKGN